MEPGPPGENKNTPAYRVRSRAKTLTSQFIYYRARALGFHFPA